MFERTSGLLYIPMYTYIHCVSSYIYYSYLYLIDSDTIISKFEIDNKSKDMISR